MPIDPSIPLSYNPQPLGPDMGKVISSANALRQFQAQTQAMAGQNALRQLLADPKAYDASGNLTPQAQQHVMQVDPATGMEYRKAMYEQQAKEAQIEHSKTETGAARINFMASVAGLAEDAYKATKSAGRSDQDAMSAAMIARNEATKNNGGILSDADVSKVLASPFDLEKASALAGIGKDRQAKLKEDFAEKIDLSKLGLEQKRTGMEGARLGMEGSRLGVERERLKFEEGGGAGKFEIVTDPTKKDDAGNPVQYRYNVQTGKATTLSGDQPYSPGGAEKLGSSASSIGSPMDPDTIDYNARIWRETGKLPALGYGKDAAEARKAIIKRGTQMAKEEGGSAGGDIGTQADIKANSQALGVLAKTRANVSNFESTFDKELSLALSLAPKGEGGQIPVLNRWIQAGRRGLAGDPDVAAFDAAVTSAKNEYARIMSSPGATGGVTSDAARSEAEELFNGMQSPAQIKAVADTMRKGTQNRIQAIDEEYQATKARMAALGKAPDKASASGSSSAPPNKPATASSAPVKLTGTLAEMTTIYNNLKPGDRYIAPDGTTKVKQ